MCDTLIAPLGSQEFENVCPETHTHTGRARSTEMAGRVAAYITWHFEPGHTILLKDDKPTLSLIHHWFYSKLSRSSFQQLPKCLFYKY